MTETLHCIRVPLTRGKFALVDKCDAELILGVKWVASPNGNTWYAQRTVRREDGRRTTQKMHQLLTGWKQTDHANGDGLDNRRANLREATNAQNQFNTGPQVTNTSGFKGVHRSPRLRTPSWVATIQAGGVRRFLGTFASPAEAAQAYDEAARELHGGFAFLNFPNGDSK